MPTGTKRTGRRAGLGSKMRAYFELDLTDIHKTIPEAEHEFSQNRLEVARDREAGR